ncbi:hypothetical protein MLD38_015306 [Melastoma candidum]|nr:hypothetical protein MLD38_015306 [Melastoma candidum]
MNCLPLCRPEPMLFPNQMQSTRLETMNSGLVNPECSPSQVPEQHSLVAAPPSYPLFYENSTSYRGDCAAVNMDASSRARDLGAVYPLYHGVHFRAGEAQSVSDSPRGNNANTILVGRPVGTSGAEPKQANVTQNLLSQESLESRSNFCSRTGYVKMGKRLSPGEKCDLSLRLSLSSEPMLSGKGMLDCESEDDDSWCSLEDSMLSASPMENSQEFCFFPRGTMTTKLQEHAPCK